MSIMTPSANGKQIGWFRVPNALVTAEGITAYAIAVYTAIAMHANKKGACWPSLHRIQNLTRLCRNSTIRAIRLLERLDFVRVVRDTGKSNVYQCTPCTGSPREPVHHVNQTGSPREPVPVHHVNQTGSPGEPELDSTNKTKKQDPKTRPTEAGKEEFSSQLNTPEFQTAWTDWIEHHRQIGKPYKAKAREELLKQLADWGPDRACAAIRFSVANNYAGIYEPKKNGERADPSAATKAWAAKRNNK